MTDTATKHPPVASLTATANGADVELVVSNLVMPNGAVVTRNGKFLGFLESPDTTFTDEAVPAGSYGWDVEALSGRTVSANATVVAPPPPPPGAALLGIYQDGQTPASQAALAASLGVRAPGIFGQYTDGATWASVTGYRPPPLPPGLRLHLSFAMLPNTLVSSAADMLSQVKANLPGVTAVAEACDALAIPRFGWESQGNQGTVPITPGQNPNGSYAWCLWGAGVYAECFDLMAEAWLAVHPTAWIDWNTLLLSTNGGRCQTGEPVAQLKPTKHTHQTVDPYDNNWPLVDEVIPTILMAQADGKGWAMSEYGLDGKEDPVYIQTAAALIKGQTVTDLATGKVYSGYPAASWHNYFNLRGSQLAQAFDPLATEAYKNAFAAV